MALIFHKKPIELSSKTLQSLLDKYASYSEEVKASGTDEEQYDEYASASNLISGGIENLKMSRNALQALIDKLQKEYDEARVKGNKKELVNEVEEIEKDTGFTEKIAKANDLIYILNARVTEARNQMGKLARKLGINKEEPKKAKPTLLHEMNSHQQTSLESGVAEQMELLTIAPEDASWLTEENTPSMRSREDDEDVICRTLKPKQLKVPRFYGDEEEFPEFWAIYTTLVHQSKYLSTVEKMMLLKDSLRGRADLAVKGIQLIPANYEWMLNALKKKFGNKPINRAKIVQKLIDLPSAKNTADGCMHIFDKIRMLMNQMISAGQNIDQMQDALWTEKILEKFPYTIVKNVLVSLQEKDEVKIEELMDSLEREINAKRFVDTRLRNHAKFENKPIARHTSNNTSETPQQGKSCYFCDRNDHIPANCRTVPDAKRRRELVKDGNVCWKCFSDKHNSFDCRKPNCPKCGRPHEVSLCASNSSNSNEGNSARYSTPGRLRNQGASNIAPRADNSSAPRYPYNPRSGNTARRDQRNVSQALAERNNYTAENHVHIDKKREQIVLMTAEGNVWNHNSGQFEKLLFFFDTGAQKTIIREQTAKDFGLATQTTEICTMSGIGGHTEKYQTNIVSLKISNAFGKELNMTIQTKPIITNGFSSVRLVDFDKQYLQDKGIYVCNPRVRGEHQNPQILVGLDYYYELVHSVDTVSLPSGLRIAHTVFGPTIHGKGSTHLPSDESNIVHGLTLVQEQTETELLQKIFELDGLGISTDECAKDDNTFEYFTKYSKSISFENGVVTVPFPLKDNIVDLADNYAIAYRRLISLQRQLANSDYQREWYEKIMTEYIQKDVVEEVCKQHYNAVGTYYMPHSGVWRPEKPKPLRIVFDASSKRVAQLSLNDVIQTGESFVNKIHDILIASRTSKIIVLCDIEAAFTQIRLVNEHKDLCRFLWLKNVKKPATRENIVEYRFNRLPFGNTSAPSILNMAILAYLNQKNTPLSLEIAKNIYVDNILLLADTIEEAIAKYAESKRIFQEIGMNLREYVSNSAEVNAAIPEHDRAPPGNMKFLGVNYDIRADEFTVNVNAQMKQCLTKRDIVSQVNSVYDPIGLAAPLLIKMKSLMREIYATGIDWKDKVPEKLCEKWNLTLQEVNNASIKVPRLLLQSTFNSSKVSLWVFCDASKMAIATCAYLRCESTNKVSQLISGKSKLTPKKTQQTIPRLELLGILIALRMANNILQAITTELRAINVASDSEIALFWIKSSRKLPTFVSNQKERISRLKAHLESKSVPVHFYHIATQHNPADVGTRGITAMAGSEHDWVRGPRWLENDPQSWLLKSIDSLRSDHSYEESDDKEQVTAEITVDAPLPSRLVIDLQRFSRYKTALRTFARVGKLLKRWTQRCNEARSTSISLDVLSAYETDDHITATDMMIAERNIIAAMHDGVQLQLLQKRFPNQKVFKDQHGIIRYKSRLQNASLPYDTKMPIFIPNDSELVRLIINDLHHANAHCGKDQTLALARQRFWIPQPSRVIKKYLRSCVVCRKCHGLPFGAPEMPPLPADRVVITKPFANVGCDYMGPFETDKKEKMYVCLYTCLTTRAVHLEVVENLSTAAFLNSFVRFISRRGVPQIIRSDGGTNFKLGQKVIETLFTANEETHETVMNYCASEGIKWVFNPPASPWMGGVWERMVGSVKRCLQKCIGRKKLSFEQMSTVMTKIEAIINTRPLTKVSSSDIDEIPLRPIDFLQGNLKYSVPEATPYLGAGDMPFDPNLLQTVAQAQEAMYFSENIATSFWERWSKEYLTTLRDTQRILLKQPRHGFGTPSVGEIVLIEQDFIPRGHWSYGKVLETMVSADGHIRTAKILMPNQRVIQRPLNKLYPLEIQSVPEAAAEEPENRTNKEKAHEQSTESLPIEQRRALAPRKSKTRALEVIQQFERSLEEPSTSSPHVPTYMLLALIALSTISPTAAYNSSIICNKGNVRIASSASKFELCINKVCNILTNMSFYEFDLPKSSLSRGSMIAIRSPSEEGFVYATAYCDPPDFCEKSAALMSIELIGNPHCWPLGAIMTLAVSLYIITIAMLATIWFCKATIISRKRRVSQSDNNEQAPMNQFLPQPIGTRTVTIACITILTLINAVSGCQHGYMRHTVEVVCDSKQKCAYTYSEEVLFNRITSNLCIEIIHANKTIGLMKLRMRPMKLKCSKVSLFFTRETKHRVFHATRCAEAGSCTHAKCSRLRPDEIVPELNSSAHFPGYSMCDATCGGIVCGCFLPVPACTFLRIAHVPISDTIYEIVNCIEWKPIIQIEMDFMLYNKGKIKQFDLEPYLMHKHEDISLTVISMVKPHSPLMDKRFALSSRNNIILPDYYQLPVECDSEETAAEHFANCTNRMICSCENFKAPQSCQCPPNSLQSLRKQVTNVFPIRTSFTEINVEGNDVYAFSKEAEITLAIQSNLMIGGAQYVIDQPCKISAGEVKGCYSCSEGARIDLSCEAVEDSWVTVQCERHVFSVECGPTNNSTQLSLDFDHAIISENCFVICGEIKKTFRLEGLLNYHPRDTANIVSQTDAEELSGGKPFYDINIPDLSPLIDTVKAHWKLAVATFGATAVLVGVTYLFGPTAVLLIVKVTISLAIAVLNIALHIAKSVVTTLASVISILLCGSRD